MRNLGTLGTIAFLGASSLLAFTGWYYINLPTVYESYPDGKVVCVLDAEGNEIPFNPEMTKYHHKYAEACPSK